GSEGQAAAPATDTTQIDTTATKKSQSNTNEIAHLTITFRAVSLSSAGPDAKQAVAFSVLDEIKNNPLFDPEDTKLNGTIGAEEPPGTFTFGINVKMKRPLKL